MVEYDLLIKGGKLVDPASNRYGPFDIALANRQVARVEPEISSDMAREIFDASGNLVFPGLIDTHVHLGLFEQAVGFRMLAKAGVTCVLDCTGFVEDIIGGISSQGSGISVAVLHRLEPGVSISGPQAGKKELAEYLERSLEAGAFGLKLIGGHQPLNPETTTAAIQVANEAGAYVAFHCGSTRNGSNLHGLLDALEFAGTNRLHICHVNAYCRGLTHGSPVDESMIALKELAVRPHLISESHMGPYNACWSRLESGVPWSHVTRTCLERGGFEATRKGLVSAARSGYMRVQKRTTHGIVYLEPEEGVTYLEEMDLDCMVSFPVNERSTAFLMATEKDEQGRFVVTALSTDGGGIPRNFLLSHGLSLVRFDALTLQEFVHKCCWAPAQMLGLHKKGHLAPGADGDLVVVDPKTHQALLTIAGGEVAMINGVVFGSGGTIITTAQGKKSLKGRGISVEAVDLSRCLLYSDPARRA